MPTDGRPSLRVATPSDRLDDAGRRFGNSTTYFAAHTLDFLQVTPFIFQWSQANDRICHTKTADPCAKIATCPTEVLQRPNWVGPPASLGEGWRLHKQICGRRAKPSANSGRTNSDGNCVRDRRRRADALAGVPLERRESRHAGTVESSDGR